MMPLADAQVMVRRLHYRGEAGLRGRVLDAIDATPWPPLPATEYLLLRRLRVRGAWWAMAGLTNRAATEQAARAVPGWHPDARQADAVRFTSLAELLACLSIDLNHPRTGPAWYWELWQALFDLPAGEAVTRLWCEHALELPALFAELQACEAWIPVMASVSAPGLERLLAAIGAATGWRPPEPPGTPSPQSVDGSPPAATEVAAQVPTRATPRCSAWLGLIRSAPSARHPALRRLAVLTLAWEFDPAALRVPQRLAAWSRALDAGQTSPGPPATARAGGARGAAPPAPALPADGIAPASPGPIPREGPRRPPGHSGPVPEPAAHPGPPTHPVRPLARQVLGGEARPPRSDDTAPPAPQGTAGPSRAVESFHTRQGGLFYLLNILNRPWVLDLLQDDPASGWQRLYRLGLALGMQAEPALGQFFAARLDLAAPRERLSTVPPLSQEEVLLARLDHDWGRYGFWGPAVLGVPARIDHGPSHLDAHYPLERIDLEIRLAGLDQDPGWLPWLGRVVSFHYAPGPGTGAPRAS